MQLTMEIRIKEIILLTLIVRQIKISCSVIYFHVVRLNIFV